VAEPGDDDVFDDLLADVQADPLQHRVLFPEV
jgi:hypothetical protein